MSSDSDPTLHARTVLRGWITRVWRRALARDVAYDLRENASYRICTELWRLPTREPRFKDAA
jgi:hypothetical protein